MVCCCIDMGNGLSTHGGMMAVEASNTRWCSDGFEIGCDNGEQV
jgi:putative transposase